MKRKRTLAPTSVRFIVHGLSQAQRAAEAATALGVPVTLASAAGAAGYAGPLWFAALIASTRARCPGAEIEAVLDCGDDPACALAALRAGITRLSFDGPRRTADKLVSIAACYGAVIERTRPPALDLGSVPDAAAAARRWLAERRVMDKLTSRRLLVRHRPRPRRSRGLTP